MCNHTRKNLLSKPAKPHPNFPLFLHNRKIRHGWSHVLAEPCICLSFLRAAGDVDTNCFSVVFAFPNGRVPRGAQGRREAGEEARQDVCGGHMTCDGRFVHAGRERLCLLSYGGSLDMPYCDCYELLRLFDGRRNGGPMWATPPGNWQHCWQHGPRTGRKERVANRL